MINTNAIYVLWLREIKKFVRSKSRIIGMLGMPLFFLAFLGFGFRSMPVAGMPEVDFITFLIPGIISMGLVFTSMFAGVSVLWDKQFGFLKEIMVAPVKRISIVIGRILGGVTTSLIQAFMILVIGFLIGFKFIGILGLLISILFMFLLSATFIGIGLIIASRMRDMHGFQLIVNFLVLPLIFLSGALFPLENLPGFIRILAYANPITYGVDGMRAALIGVSTLPILYNFIALTMFSLVTIFLGAYFFEKSNNV